MKNIKDYCRCGKSKNKLHWECVGEIFCQLQINKVKKVSIRLEDLSELFLYDLRTGTDFMYGFSIIGKNTLFGETELKIIK